MLASRVDKLFAAGAQAPGRAVLSGPWTQTAQEAWISSLRLSPRQTLGATVASQPRFALGADGALTASTDAARQLLAGPHGEQWSRAMGGLHASLDAAGGANALHRVSLASSGRDFALGSMLNWAEGYRGARLHVPATPDAAAGRELVRALRSDGRAWMLRLGGANAEDGAVALSPSVTRTLRRAVDDAGAGRTGVLARRRGEGLAYILRHEGEHAVSPTLHLDKRTLQFEEAVADVLARWPGATAETAAAMGIAHQAPTRMAWTRSPMAGYVDSAANMRVLLELGGIDTSTRGARREAARLLQSTAVEDGVATRIAQRILERRGGAAGDVEALATRVVDAASDRRALRRLVADLDAPETLRPLRQMRRDTLVQMLGTPLGGAALVGTAWTGATQAGQRRDQVRAHGAASLGASGALHAGGLVAATAVGSRLGGVRLAAPLGMLAAGQVAGIGAGLVERHALDR